MTDVQHDVQQVFAGLADSTRLQILDVLAMHGATTASTIATELPVTRQAIAKHLTVLERAGLVSSNRAGREVRYVLLPARMEVASQWLSRVAEDWAVRLGTIAHATEGDPTPT